MHNSSCNRSLTVQILLEQTLQILKIAISSNLIPQDDRHPKTKRKSKPKRYQRKFGGQNKQDSPMVDE